MREIKFRAWDKTEKVMRDSVTGLHFSFTMPVFEKGKCVIGDGQLSGLSFDCENGEQQDEEISRFEVMQFTGLKDKNGKEIYEGDILEATFNEYKTGVRCEVKFWQGQFIADYRKGGGNLVCPLRERVGYGKDFCDMDIIAGNIYENPELLTVEGEK